MTKNKINNKYNIIGKNIKKYRLKNNLSQNDICHKMELYGIVLYQKDIYRIEYGLRTIRDFEIYAFSQILKVNIETLFEGVKKEFE